MRNSPDVFCRPWQLDLWLAGPHSTWPEDRGLGANSRAWAVCSVPWTGICGTHLIWLSMGCVLGVSSSPNFLEISFKKLSSNPFVIPSFSVGMTNLFWPLFSSPPQNCPAHISIPFFRDLCGVENTLSFILVLAFLIAVDMALPLCLCSGFKWAGIRRQLQLCMNMFCVECSSRLCRLAHVIPPQPCASAPLLALFQGAQKVSSGAVSSECVVLSWEVGVGRLLVHKHTPTSRMGREEPRIGAGCPGRTWWAVGVWQWESLLQLGSEEDGEGSVLVGTPEL